MSKKILIDLERLRYPYSGIANVFKNLRNGIDEIKHQENINITFYGSFTTENTNNKPWKNYHKFLETFSSKYDLIHVSHQLSSYFTKNYKDTKKIVTLHDLNMLYENLSPSKKTKMLNKVRKNLKFADYIVCISEYAKQDFIKNQHLFELKKLKDLVVIHNGIQLPQQREYLLTNYPQLINKKFILNIGVLFNKKNQLRIIEMLPYITEDLVLVCSDTKGEYQEQVLSKIKELKLENRVHFLSKISEEDKCSLLQNCEALLHPSIAEGFGIPPIEAMSFGKPVFLSKLTSLPEIGGDVAYYFDSFEPEEMAATYKQKLAEYKADEKQKSEAIKKWTSQFDYQVMSKNYMEFYKKVLS